ncbi:MAG: methyl-accepting chemotaxis protein [Rhizobiaceae bacterium]
MMVKVIKHRWSLTTRLVFMAVVAVALSLGLFAMLTVVRLEQGAWVQEQAVSRLARDRIGEQMRLQVRLITEELQQVSVQTEGVVRALATREDTHKVLARGNIVAIDRLLKTAVASSTLDGLLALDTHLNALGSHKPGLLLVNANRVFTNSNYAALTRGLILGNDRRKPVVHTQFSTGKNMDLLAFGLAVKADKLVVVSIHPVFDDFGDVAAVLVAHRIVKSSDAALTRFVNNESLGMRILNGAHVLLSAGIKNERVEMPPHSIISEMDVTKNGSNLFQCELFNSSWRVCIYKPMIELTELTDSLVDFIKDEKRSLVQWLGLLTLGSIGVVTLASIAGIRRVMAPLQQITQAVRSVAKGNWLAHVAGQRRRDEVGDIARAVSVLQRSMKERERLRVDVADIEQLKAQQLEMYQAAQLSRTEIRQHMYGLLELTDTIELGTQRLNSLVGLAEGEADEARLVIGRTINELSVGLVGTQAPARLVDESIDRLGETVEELSGGAKNISIAVGEMSQEVRGIERVIKGLMRALSDQQDGLKVEPTQTEKPQNA